MTATLMNNRSMFWRIIRRLVFAHRGRLFVILLALGAGAAITAALLNLQVDAKRRLTSEFRAFGPNLVISSPDASAVTAIGSTLDEQLVNKLPLASASGRVTGFAYLYLIGAVSVSTEKPFQTVIAGLHVLGADRLEETAKADSQLPDKQLCNVGTKVATQMHLRVGDRLMLRGPEREESCQVALISSIGGAEDSQVSPHLDVAQRLAGLPGRVSVIQLTVPGTPQQIGRYVAELRDRLPGADVRPIRQFTLAQAKIYSRISGLLNFTVGIVLVLTALCVMAAMANVAVERRNDVGLMKAIGGAKRRVLRLFLAEATLLGLAGGLLGAAAGMGLSVWLGKAVFGLAARPRLIVYPVSVLLTMIVAILSAFPLRHLANVRPASIFRGEA